MRNRKQLVSGETTGGGWSGGATRLSQPVQEVAERVQILNGYYNASTDYHYGINRPVLKQRRGIWTYMRKRQDSAISNNGDIDRPIARKFGDAVRVCYCRLLRLIGHN
jgi:hypothetical protein